MIINLAFLSPQIKNPGSERPGIFYLTRLLIFLTSQRTSLRFHDTSAYTGKKHGSCIEQNLL